MPKSSGSIKASRKVNDNSQAMTEEQKKALSMINDLMSKYRETIAHLIMLDGLSASFVCELAEGIRPIEYLRTDLQNLTEDSQMRKASERDIYEHGLEMVGHRLDEMANILEKVVSKVNPDSAVSSVPPE